ncbi:thioredoxin domain-containing protein [Thermodesulfobacteriota bacterium]
MLDQFLFHAMAILVLLLQPLTVMAGLDKNKDLTVDSTANTVADFVARQLAIGKKPNRLIKESSPYLLQHAFNPVDWFPWGDEAFARAKREGKPIFLSIGYSTCHWCHVMERESFENSEIAAIINKYFIPIKVDREERPDIDRIYMEASQAMTGSGGWPLSAFLTPDREPFYLGTYFPPESSYGRPGFAEILNAVHQAWITDRTKLEEQAAAVVAAISYEKDESPGASVLQESTLFKGFQQFSNQFDSVDGGFGTSSKFPRPVALNFLLRFHHRTGDKLALKMALTTLRKMAEGGIHDHIGGGFHRYTVDDQWRIPHFEKMLYDQAQLAVSFLEAYQMTGETVFSQAAEDIFTYVLRDMTDLNGVFYSAEDADSPLPGNPDKQGEGAFYVWTSEELVNILGKDSCAIFSYIYGIGENGNVRKDPHQEFKGKNILYQAHTVAEAAAQFNRNPDEIQHHLKESRKKLLDRRVTRPRPHLDDKVITAWNGLMISALSQGYQVLGKSRYLHDAEKAASFILKNLYDAQEKKLLRRYRAGQAGIDGHLDDYAFLVQGLIDLYEASQDPQWLTQAIRLNWRQIEIFRDSDDGFFESVTTGADLPLRVKSDYEGAEPLGNSIAALNLIRLSHFTRNEDWRKLAETTIASYGTMLESTPAALPQMLVALEAVMAKPKQVIIAGDWNSSDTREMLREVWKRFLPNQILVVRDTRKNYQELLAIMPELEWYGMRENKATAYVCEDFVCKIPVNDVKALVDLLDQG